MNKPTNPTGMKLLAMTMQALKEFKQGFTPPESESAKGKSAKDKPTKDKTTKKKSTQDKKNPDKTPRRKSTSNESSDDMWYINTPESVAHDKIIRSFGEYKPFRSAYKKLQKDIQTKAGFEPEVQHERRTKVYWKIQEGFNTRDLYNLVLQGIAVTYASYRLGIKCMVQGTEVGAGVYALVDFYTGGQSDATVNSSGRGQAWMLGIHMLNDHLTLQSVTPIAVHPMMRIDDRMYLKIREEQTKDIWVNGKLHHVESRNDVRQELIEYLKRIKNKTEEELKLPVPGAGPPSENEEETPNKGPRSIRSFAM